MHKAFRAAAALAAAAAAAGIASAAAGPGVTITSPVQGQKISARHNTYIAVAGTASFATPTAATTRFYLRRDGCGTASDNPHLSVVSGTRVTISCPNPATITASAASAASAP